MVMFEKKYFVIFIVVSTLIITYLHYSTLSGIHDLHNIFTELYYIPLLLGALAFGLKGAVITFIFITALYAPYVLFNWSGTYLFMTNKLLHALFSGIFAILAGILVDREKKRQEQSEKEHYLSGLGRAATAIVHDLKNSLITILGFSKRIRERKGNIDSASETIINATENMQKIVYDVLDFAKPARLDLKEEDTVNTVRRAYNSCEAKANEEGVVLSAHLPAEPVKLQVDNFHMERALINIINNAIEVSKKGKKVVVSAKTRDDRFFVTIKDYGPGMDTEARENVFIPFYTKKSSGTGLGMAIAKKIIEGHQGKTYINSREQMGTEVIIELPLKIF